jgi:hypothetical protein
LGTVNYSYGASIDDSLIKLQYDLISNTEALFDLNIALKPLQRYCFTEGGTSNGKKAISIAISRIIILKQLI